MKKLQESKREERKKLADEEAIRKIKQLEETVHQLQRQVAAQKQVRFKGFVYCVLLFFLLLLLLFI